MLPVRSFDFTPRYFWERMLELRMRMVPDKDAAHPAVLCDCQLSLLSQG